MSKTFALLLDAYRELNAKRLFWVVLIVSAIVVGAFGIVGLSGEYITVLNWETPFRFVYLSLITKSTFYKLLFVSLGIKFWLSWLATALALVSTAGIFPDFLAGGSIDLYLSKPLSRLRLFATKYLGGLLFVTLQVAVFSLASFLVLGLRGGSWQPALFLAIPLVVLMFSYLFSMCVLFGVLTRSTVASLLLTFVFWAVIWGLHQTEISLLRAQIFDDRRAARLDKQIAAAESELAHPATSPATQRSAPSTTGPWWERWLAFAPPETHTQTQSRLAELRDQRSKMTDRFSTPHRIAYAILTPLPKTTETIGLLERELISRAELPPVEEEDPATPTRGQPALRVRGREDRALNAEIDIRLRQRSTTWILATSCAFELAALILAASLFCRRDY